MFSCSSDGRDVAAIVVLSLCLVSTARYMLGGYVFYMFVLCLCVLECRMSLSLLFGRRRTRATAAQWSGVYNIFVCVSRVLLHVTQSDANCRRCALAATNTLAVTDSSHTQEPYGACTCIAHVSTIVHS